MHKVFVYGTLKSGHGNNRLLREANMLGREVLTLPYKFVCLGGFPGLVRTSQEPVEDATDVTQVGGEVWEVDDTQLRSLDRLEGHPDFYERFQIETSQGTAWTYVLPPARRYLEARAGNNPATGQMFWRQNEAEADWLRERHA